MHFAMVPRGDKCIKSLECQSSRLDLNLQCFVNSRICHTIIHISFYGFKPFVKLMFSKRTIRNGVLSGTKSPMILLQFSKVLKRNAFMNTKRRLVKFI